MRIEIQRNETSQPLVYENALNAYTKGCMYCVLFEKKNKKGKIKRITHKYPTCSIFRVIEDYSDSDYSHD